MQRSFILPLALLLASTPALAQDVPAEAGRCAVPDSVVVRGNTRISDGTIRSDAGFTPGVQLNFRAVQRAIETLFATGEYEDVQILCDAGSDSAKTVLAIVVRERPTLASIELHGLKRVSKRTATDSVDILVGRPLDPTLVARLVERIDSLYVKQGYYLAQVTVDSTRKDGTIDLDVRANEGSRLAVSGAPIGGKRRGGGGASVKALRS